MSILKIQNVLMRKIVLNAIRFKEYINSDLALAQKHCKTKPDSDKKFNMITVLNIHRILLSMF